MPAHAELTATAFEAAMAPLYPALVRRLVLVLGVREDAEDVAQAAYERAFRAWRAFDGRDPRAWLYTIALRLAFNELKRRRRWAGILDRAPRQAWNDKVDPDLWSALKDMDPRARATLLLNALDGYTLAEIAAMLDEPEGTVSSRLSRSRATLRATLDDR
jgi:RNA polymerase sigma-70 factor, ECF subfamily